MVQTFTKMFRTLPWQMCPSPWLHVYMSEAVIAARASLDVIEDSVNDLKTLYFCVDSTFIKELISILLSVSNAIRICVFNNLSNTDTLLLRTN